MKTKFQLYPYLSTYNTVGYSRCLLHVIESGEVTKFCTANRQGAFKTNETN